MTKFIDLMGMWVKYWEFLMSTILPKTLWSLFLGDNGGAQFRGKGTLYELGIRVPMIVRWPDKVAAGTVCHGIVSCEDLAPTFIDLAGVEIPKNITGISLKILF